MDAIKSKNARIGEPVELTLITKDKQHKNDDYDPNKESLDNDSSGKYWYRD
jgi:hypothetical protein